MEKVLGLFKSHYSKTILTLEKPKEVKNYSWGLSDKPTITSTPVSIIDLALENKLSTITLVEDTISGLLQASKNCADNKIKLIFGLRLDVNNDMDCKDEDSLSRRAKYIIFAKNNNGYKNLINIWSEAAGRGFYYNPCIDFKTIKKYWSDNMVFCVPFYDSFLHLNTLNSRKHIPEIDQFGKVTFFIEDNDLPFDHLIRNRVQSYCENKYETLIAQSIYYKSPSDYLAYVTFRCIHNRGSFAKVNIEKPNLDDMCSSEFNFEKWLQLNK